MAPAPSQVLKYVRVRVEAFEVRPWYHAVAPLVALSERTGAGPDAEVG